MAATNEALPGLLRAMEDEVYIARDHATLLDLIFNRPKVELDEQCCAALSRIVYELREASEKVLKAWGQANAIAQGSEKEERS